MIHVDLFSGIGGFHLGLKMAGFAFEKTYYSDIDAYANKVYANNFPDAIPLGDVTNVDGKMFAGRDVMITGGFPCQDISQAGKQKGITGERSGLFNEIIRIARDCTPRIIFLENVSALLTINEGRDFGYCLAELDSIGYDAQWHCVPASHVGAPHRRDRIWIVAYPKLCGRLHGQNEKQSAEIGEHALRYVGSESDDVPHTMPSGERRDKREETDEGDTFPDAESTRLEGQRKDARESAQSEPGDGDASMGNALSNAQGSAYGEGERGSIGGRENENKRERDSMGGDSANAGRQWSIEPTLGSLAHGLSAGLDVAGLGDEHIRVATKILERTNQLKALGNAVVPQVVAYVAENVVRPIIKEGERF